MSKLVDIKGYWNEFYIKDYMNKSCENDFNDNDMWEGKLLLEDDGWFEGIVVDPFSSYIENRFVFGIYFPDKVFKLYKFTPMSISNPFVFHAKKDCEGYNGMFEIIGSLGSLPYGRCRILTSHIDVKNNPVEQMAIEEDKRKLQEKIQAYKDNIMDDVGREFYENAIAQRSSLCKIILANYEGREFTTEEMQQIMEECQPVNERIMKATEEEAKRLVKEMPENLFEDDDDELPFK